MASKSALDLNEVTLRQHDVTSRKGNKKTGKDQTLSIPQVVWNDPENTGRFDYLVKTLKPIPISKKAEAQSPWCLCKVNMSPTLSIMSWIFNLPPLPTLRSGQRKCNKELFQWERVGSDQRELKMEAVY